VTWRFGIEVHSVLVLCIKAFMDLRGHMEKVEYKMTVLVEIYRLHTPCYGTEPIVDCVLR